MKHIVIGSPSIKELFIVIVSAFILTLLMGYLNAYERLYLFTRMYKIYGFDDFAVFLPAFLAMGFLLYSYRRIEELQAEITKREQAEAALRESEQKYRELSITDDLTQLHNSRHFYKRVEAEIDRSMRYNHPLSLLLLDIDNFKQYNDTYGHLEGDKVLHFLGTLIMACLRKTDSAYRYGGEEFMVILPVTYVGDASHVAERIRKGFEEKTFSPRPSEEAHCTLSMGVGQYEPEEELEAFIKRVDIAMYMAKNEGKNRVSFSKQTHVDQNALLST
jgi:diguanylate cyclase (GGDEF)-like protein